MPWVAVVVVVVVAAAGSRSPSDVHSNSTAVSGQVLEIAVGEVGKETEVGA